MQKINRYILLFFGLTVSLSAKTYITEGEAIKALDDAIREAAQDDTKLGKADQIYSAVIAQYLNLIPNGLQQQKADLSYLKQMAGLNFNRELLSQIIPRMAQPIAVLSVQPPKIIPSDYVRAKANNLLVSALQRLKNEVESGKLNVQQVGMIKEGVSTIPFLTPELRDALIATRSAIQKQYEARAMDPFAMQLMQLQQQIQMLQAAMPQ